MPSAEGPEAWRRWLLGGPPPGGPEPAAEEPGRPAGAYPGPSDAGPREPVRVPTVEPLIDWLRAAPRAPTWTVPAVRPPEE